MARCGLPVYISTHYLFPIHSCKVLYLNVTITACQIYGKVLHEVKIHLYQQCDVAVSSAHINIHCISGQILCEVGGHT